MRTSPSSLLLLTVVSGLVQCAGVCAGGVLPITIDPGSNKLLVMVR